MVDDESGRRIVLRIGRGPAPLLLAVSVVSCHGALPSDLATTSDTSSVTADTGEPAPPPGAAASMPGPAAPQSSAPAASDTSFIVEDPSPPEVLIQASPSSTADDSSTIVVAVPEPGTPADPGQICAVDLTEVTSNDAARVTLVTGADWANTSGMIALDSRLADQISGTPSIEIIDASDAFLKDAKLGPVKRVSAGYSLDDALVFTTADGSVIGKQDDLAAHRARRLRLSRFEPSDLRVHRFGSTAVVTVQMLAEGTWDGAPANGRLRYTRVWCEGPQGWRLVAGHMSAVQS